MKRQLRIGIDGSPLAIPYPCGVKNYAKNLLFALAEIDKKNTYFIFSTKKVNIPKQKNFISVTTDGLAFFKQQLLIPMSVIKKDLDVYHLLEPYSSVFYLHPRTVATIHDLDLRHNYPFLGKHLLTRLYNEARRYFVLNNAHSFITNSKFIKNELKELLNIYNIPQKRIQTVALAADKDFSFKNHTRNKNYFLCMGDFSKRKNISTLLSSYKKLPEDIKDKFILKMICSTKKAADFYSDLARKHEISEGLKIYVGPSQKDLVDLYRNGYCFVYPSIYEGFGIPILEAMSSGCPVITSDFGAMKEVSGNAALLTNTRSAVGLAKTITKLTKDKHLRVSLIKKGYDRAKEFSWEKTARKTLEIYKRTAQ